ncbi:unnamed protein product [Calypogeia fissa]
MAKAKKLIEAGKSVRDLKTLESLLTNRQQTVAQVGDPPSKFLKAAKRVIDKPPTHHRLGQGGLPGLKAAFYKRYRRKNTSEEMETGHKHGKAHLYAQVDATLESEEDSDEDEEKTTDEEDSPPPPPPPPAGGGAATSTRDQSFALARGSGSGGTGSQGDEEEEDQEDQEEHEEHEEQTLQVDPPSFRRRRRDRETTRKKGGRKRKAPF